MQTVRQFRLIAANRARIASSSSNLSPLPAVLLHHIAADHVLAPDKPAIVHLESHWKVQERLARVRIVPRSSGEKSTTP